MFSTLAVSNTLNSKPTSHSCCAVLFSLAVLGQLCGVSVLVLSHGRECVLSLRRANTMETVYHVVSWEEAMVATLSDKREYKVLEEDTAGRMACEQVME